MLLLLSAPAVAGSDAARDSDSAGDPTGAVDDKEAGNAVETCGDGAPDTTLEEFVDGVDFSELCTVYSRDSSSAFCSINCWTRPSVADCRIRDVWIMRSSSELCCFSWSTVWCI